MMSQIQNRLGYNGCWKFSMLSSYSVHIHRFWFCQAEKGVLHGSVFELDWWACVEWSQFGDDRQKGFKNLFTLKGGVARYLKEEGSSMWAGNLFVFDSRLSVPPEYYCDKEHEKVEENELKESDTGSEAQNLSAFARCQLCGGPLPEARHRNCANLDCNKLYLYVPFFISPNSAHCSLRPICKTFSLVI